MNIFKRKQKTSNQLDLDLKEANVSEAKARAQSAQKGSAIKGLFLSAIAIGALAFSYKTFEESQECKGVCGVDVNQQLIDEGFAKGETPEHLEGHTAWVVEYSGMYKDESSKAFRKKLQKVSAVSKRGDRVILKINSNGGDAISCSTDYAMVQSYKKQFGLKVIAQIDRAAHSCGYYLATSADVIVVQQGASVGNIGSAITMFSNPVDGLIKKITGAEKVTIGSTRVKEIFAGDSLKSKEDRAIVKRYVQESANNFYKDVIEGRGGKIKEEDYPMVFSAYPFPARKAKELGLVDKLMGYHQLMLTYHWSGMTIKEVVLK